MSIMGNIQARHTKNFVKVCAINEDTSFLGKVKLALFSANVKDYEFSLSMCSYVCRDKIREADVVFLSNRSDEGNRLLSELANKTKVISTIPGWNGDKFELQELLGWNAYACLTENTTREEDIVSSVIGAYNASKFDNN